MDGLRLQLKLSSEPNDEKPLPWPRVKGFEVSSMTIPKRYGSFKKTEVALTTKGVAAQTSQSFCSMACQGVLCLSLHAGKSAASGESSVEKNRLKLRKTAGHLARIWPCGQ